MNQEIGRDSLLCSRPELLARSALGTVKSQTQPKNTHGEQGKREPHVRGGPIAERRQMGK